MLKEYAPNPFTIQSPTNKNGCKFASVPSSWLIFDSEIVEYGFIVVLCREAGVCKVAVNMSPLTQAPIVEYGSSCRSGLSASCDRCCLSSSSPSAHEGRQARVLYGFAYSSSILRPKPTNIYMRKNQYAAFLSFLWRLYSFFVMRMKEPCCGAVTPLMFSGLRKLRMNLSALQMR